MPLTMETGKPSHFKDEHNMDWAPTLNLEKNVSYHSTIKTPHENNPIREEEKAAVDALLNLHVPRFSDIQQNIDNSYNFLNIYDESIPIRHDIKCHRSSVNSNINNGSISLVSDFTCKNNYVHSLTNMNDISNRAEYENISFNTYSNIQDHSISKTKYAECENKVIDDCTNMDDVISPEIIEGHSHIIVTNNIEENKEEDNDLCKNDVHIQSLEMQNKYLLSELIKLKHINSNLELTENSFIGNDEKVKFYTGIHSYSVLMLVFNNTCNTIKHNNRNRLSKFQEYILTLMKLRLNCPFKDLSYRFFISVSTVSRIFRKWVRNLSFHLKQLIIWPNKENIQNTMPPCFKNSFGVKVVVILDCFEIAIERPSSLIARAMTWSNYKHNNTIKILLGITPQGTISFVSKAWGGRVSDKYLTENCGLLNKLSPGDLVLADRGFTVADSIGLVCAKLMTPAFTKGKQQLSSLEVVETRKIANVRIHVERLIGLVRQKYKILNETIPFDFLNEKGRPLIDDIITTCCALTNLCPSVVPKD